MSGLPNIVLNVRIFLVSTSLDEIVARRKVYKDLTQPYLLAYTPDGTTGFPSQTFLILDYQKIEVSGNITTALEMLFMCFYAFNLQLS